jgi:hypothetical protein
MLNGITKVFVERRDYAQSIGLYLYGDYDAKGECPIITTVVFERGVHQEGAYNGEPAITLRKEIAQRLIDAMWDAGMRPTQAGANARDGGEIDATRHHLEDMRAIAFAKTGVRQP